MPNKEQKKPLADKPTMEKALGNRMSGEEVTVSQPTTPIKPNPAEEQTHDEIMEQALAEATVEDAMLSQEPPQVGGVSGQVRAKIEAVEDQSQPEKSSETLETIPIQPETVTSTSSPPEKGQPIIPVSNIDRLHATATSTRESAEPLGKKQRVPEDNGYSDLDIDPTELREGALDCLLDYIHSNEYSEAWVQLHISSISSFPKVLPMPTLWDIPNNVNMANLVYNIVLTVGFVENVWPYLRLIMGSSRDNVNWVAAVLTTLALFEAIKLLPYTIENANS